MNVTRSKFKVKVKITVLLKFRKLHFSRSISSAIYNGAGKWPPILKLRNNIWIWSGWIFDICPTFCHVTFNLEENYVPCKNVITIRLKIATCVMVGEWCSTECQLTRSKDQGECPFRKTPLKRSRPSIPRGTNYSRPICNRAAWAGLWFLLLSSFFFSSPNLSCRRLDVYHTSTHGVALV